MSTQLITEDCGGREGGMILCEVRYVWRGRRSKSWQQSGRGNRTIKYEVSAYNGSDTGPGNNRVARYSRVPAVVDLSLAGGAPTTDDVPSRDCDSERERDQIK